MVLCVLSEDPKSGRNETVWVHMRNCLNKCHRTQVRPATNEDAEGTEAVASLFSGLTKAIHEGCTRHFADITDEGDPEDNEETVVEGYVTDVCVGRPDLQPKSELNVPSNSDFTLGSTRSETHAEPKAEVSTSTSTDMETGASDRRIRLREESTDSPRYHVDVPQDQESMVGPRGKTPRRSETREHRVHLRSAEASS